MPTSLPLSCAAAPKQCRLPVGVRSAKATARLLLSWGPSRHRICLARTRVQGEVVVTFPRHAETYTCSLPALVLAAPLAQVGAGWGVDGGAAGS